MTRNGKRLTLTVVLATAGAIVGILAGLGKLGWGPWQHPTKEAVTAEVVAQVQDKEDAQHKVHEALIQRIERGEDDARDDRKEQLEVNKKLDRRLWQILQEVKK